MNSTFHTRRCDKRLRTGFVSFLLLLLCSGIAAHAEELRTWTSRDGKYTVRAEFLKLERGTVYLRKEDGKEIGVPIGKLSATDQRWARSAARKARTKEPQAGATEEASSSRASGDRSPASAEWYQWRGANRDGKSTDTGLLKDWTQQPPKLLWTAHGLGAGRSSVVVSGGKIFTMGVLDGGTCLIALSESDGSLLWKTPIEGEGSAIVNCTPTLDGDLVFGTTFRGTLACADATSGEVRWKKSFARDFGGKMMSQWGYSESPLVDGDRVIVTPGGPQATMVALDKTTGRLVWRSPVGSFNSRTPAGAGYSSAVISNACGVRQYVQLVGHGVIGVAAKDGRPLWTYARVANSTANISTPIVSGDYVFCSTGYQTGAALLQLVRRGGRIMPREVYFLNHERLQNHHGGMIQIGEYLFCGHGHNQGFPICIHLPTGRTAWGPERGPGRRSAAIAYADGNLYFRYEDGTMALIEANPQEYRLKGTFKIATRHAESWPHPVIAGGKLYLRDQNDLHCYDLRATRQ